VDEEKSHEQESDPKPQRHERMARTEPTSDQRTAAEQYAVGYPLVGNRAPSALMHFVPVADQRDKLAHYCSVSRSAGPDMPTAATTTFGNHEWRATP